MTTVGATTYNEEPLVKFDGATYGEESPDPPPLVSAAPHFFDFFDFWAELAPERGVVQV